MLERALEYDKMAEAETELWWYRILHELVYRNALKQTQKSNQAPRDVAILDAACGTGGLWHYLEERGFGQIDGFDLSPHALAACQKRGLNPQLGDLRSVGDNFAGKRYQAIICNDALCYLTLDECRAVAQQFYELLASDGVVIANVPALKAFSGMHDRGVGIKHRFNRADARAIFPAAQFTLERLQYWPFLLSPLIFSLRAAQRIELRLKPETPIRSDVSVPHPFLNRLFQGLTRLEQLLGDLPPFGSSLFVVARKREHAAVERHDQAA